MFTGVGCLTHPDRGYADMAELADAPDLGSGVYDVQVQVLLSASDYDVVYGYRIAARNYRTPL